MMQPILHKNHKSSQVKLSFQADPTKMLRLKENKVTKESLNKKRKPKGSLKTKVRCRM